ncbi:unnamed protein product, partial [Rotaria magnacalcarata]
IIKVVSDTDVFAVSDGTDFGVGAPMLLFSINGFKS